ncbi:MAG: ABC transporter permease [Nocardioidaceae bacterium]
MRRAIWVEWRKVRRSPVTLVTTGLLVVPMPLLVLGFLAVAEKGGVGAASVKAQALVVDDGWPGYLFLAGQLVSVTMFIGPGVVAAWVFGREFADRTFPSLFALPVSRRSIAAAKLVVLIGWGALVSLLVVLAVGLIGVLADVGPEPASDVLPGLGRLLAACLLTVLLATTLGLVASVGRGHLPAIGVMILLVMAAQVSVLFGTGGWFPYAAPGLMAVAGGEGVPLLAPAQVLLVPVTGAVAGWLTVRWWGRAEVS